MELFDEAEVISGSEVKNQTALAPIGDDLSSLEKRIESGIAAYQRILGMAISGTHAGDWANLGGKPYLMSQGAERIARPFGIWVSTPKIWKEDRQDAKGKYFIYFCQMVVGSKLLDAEMAIEGACDSRDKFFAMEKGNLKPIEDVSEKDIRKKAYTNAFVNGVTRLLGLRQLKWDFLAKNGIKREETATVEYGGKGATDLISEAQSKLLYAKSKGKEQAGASMEVIMTDFKEKFGVEKFKDLPKNKCNDAIAWLDAIKV